MNDIRRTILWVVFAFSLIMLWDQWQVHNGRQATFFPRTQPPTAAAPAATASAPASVPGAASANASASAPATASALPATTPAGAVPEGAAPARERIEVSTDVLRLVFDSEGGSIIESELLKYPDATQADKRVVLFETRGQQIYQAQSGLIGGPFPNHKTPMKFSGQRELAAGAQQLVLRFESVPAGGVKLVKTYTLERGSYVIGVAHEVINVGPAPVAPQLYLQLVRDGSQPSGSTPFYSTFTGPAFYSDEKKYQKVDFGDIDKNKDISPSPRPMATLPWSSTTLPVPGCSSPMPPNTTTSRARSTTISTPPA